MVVHGRQSQPNQRISSSTAAAASGEKSDASKNTLSQTGPSDTSPAVPVETIYKLLAFTFAMIFAPLASYFLSVKTIFVGNATLAGALAAFIANVVLVGYIIVAWQEDSEEQAKSKEKKGQ